MSSIMNLPINWTTRIKVIFWDLGGVLIQSDHSVVQTTNSTSFHKWQSNCVDWNLVSFVRLLRRRYRVAALCDTPARLRQALEQNLKVAATFDVVLRCGPQDYPYALRQMGVEPGQALLVDDNREQCRRAQALGTYAIWHTSTAETITAVMRLLAAEFSTLGGSTHDILEQLQQRAGAAC